MTVRGAAGIGAPDTPPTYSRPPADNPWHTAEHAVKLVCALFEAHVVALFGLAGERPILLASHGVTQSVLELVGDAWVHARATLATGQPHGSAELPALVLPCSDERGLAGLAYIEGDGVRRRSSLPLLLPLSQILARVARGGIDHGAAPRVDGRQEAVGNPDAAELYVLMERNEWNVARVARLIGVTRMTIYNRLRRAGLTRKRVAKAPRRGRRSGRPAPPDADTPMAS